MWGFRTCGGLGGVVVIVIVVEVVIVVVAVTCLRPHVACCVEMYAHVDAKHSNTSLEHDTLCTNRRGQVEFYA